MPPDDLKPPHKKKVGFALMAPADAAAAGRKGGAAPRKEPRPFAKDKRLAIEAGRKGGTISKGGGRPPGTYTPAQSARSANMLRWAHLRRDPMFPKQED